MSFTFNAHEVAPASPSERVLLPPGKYQVRITTAEYKANSKNTGFLLHLGFEVAAGEFEGVALQDNLNLQHQVPKAEQIGRGRFSALCRAIAASLPTAKEKEKVMIIKNADFTPLLGKSVVVKIINEEGSPFTDRITGEIVKGRMQNVVSGFFPATEVVAAPAVQVIATKAPVAAAPEAAVAPTSAKSTKPSW